MIRYRDNLIMIIKLLYCGLPRHVVMNEFVEVSNSCTVFVYNCLNLHGLISDLWPDDLIPNIISSCVLHMEFVDTHRIIHPHPFCTLVDKKL